MQERIIAFGILSIPVIFLSWRSLSNIRNHGFYRFFSWECILWLAVNNYKYWFMQPFKINQLISWLFLIYSLYLIIFGVMMMRRHGKSQTSREDNSLYTFEKTTALIESGIFRYIRHPLYASLLFLSWGIFLKNTNLLLLAVTLASSIFLFITAKFEEKEDSAFFGNEYREYMKRTKMFIPFVL